MNKVVSVTIDIEDWYHVPAVSGSSFSKFEDTSEFFANWEGRYDYLTRPTMRTLDILNEFGIKGTFFIVSEVVHRYPSLVESIKNAGHEIACHGLDHMCYIDSQTKQPIQKKSLFRSKMVMAKKILEDVTSKTVKGFRSPAAYMTGWMLDILEEIGFEYDSSISVNNLYNKTDSPLRTVGRVPYYPKIGGLELGEKRKIIEIPFPYFKIGGFKLPAAGGPFLRFLGSRFILAGLKQTLQHGSAFLYFHPLDISQEKFPSSFSANRPFYWAIKGRTVENRVRTILSKIDAEFVTMDEMARMWKKRLDKHK